ncbi:MAG: PSD1 and planctomycete cytochrome C domain-containing protein [Planctomycetota bacterium]
MWRNHFGGSSQPRNPSRFGLQPWSPDTFMTFFPRRFVCLATIGAAVLASPGDGFAEPAGRSPSYSADVKPILAAKCFHCHGQDEHDRRAGLRLDTFEAATADLGGYAAIVVGDADRSELIQRVIDHDPDVVMPPPESGEPLTAEEIATLRRWVGAGAEYEAHWAFTKPAPPDGFDGGAAGGGAAAIDHFVSRRLSEAGLSLRPEANRRTLVRRLSLDLRGVPPGVEEVEAFLADTQPGAYERLLDRLLLSPQLAERLTVDWLDSARYGDTNGFSIDDGRFMWAWRDWVIKSFAQNLPYDRFLTMQLAGDLLPDATEEDLLATGFLRCGMNTHEGGTLPEEYRVISIADKVDAVATTFLGMTVRCAQCHDHKYDPISQTDYYAFYALFNTTTEPGHGAKNGNTAPTAMVRPPLESAWRRGLRQRIADLEATLRTPYPALSAARDAWEARQKKALLSTAASQRKEGGKVDAAELNAALHVAKADRTDEQWGVVNGAFADDHKPMRDLLNSIGAETAAERKQLKDGRVWTMVMDHDPARVTHRLDRGQYDQPREEVAPGVPGGLGPNHSVTNRLQLARWLTDPDHPLTSRVAVNRYWQLIFGRGLVETSEDFGVRADLPSHPELLDWLAVDFVANGWDVRRLLRQIVMSKTYRQSAAATSEAIAADPTNRLLSRSECRRLPAEFVRDNALAVGGLIESSLGGPPVLPPQPAGLWREVSHYGHPDIFFTAQAYHPSRGDRQRRRSLYTYWKRSSPPPMLSAFDAPTRETCVTRRGRTTTPLQALVLWNEPQFVAAARGLAGRAIEAGSDDDARLDRLFEIALSRLPSDLERAVLMRQLEASKQRFTGSPGAAAQVTAAGESVQVIERAAWTLVTSTVMNLHEFNSRP